MSLYGPTFHVTPVDLCIIFQCNLYISCIKSCGNKIVLNCFKLFQIVSRNDENLRIARAALKDTQAIIYSV